MVQRQSSPFLGSRGSPPLGDCCTFLSLEIGTMNKPSARTRHSQLCPLWEFCPPQGHCVLQAPIGRLRDHSYPAAQAQLPELLQTSQDHKVRVTPLKERY